MRALERLFMVSMEDLRAAVERAKEMLSDCGIDVDVTADQVWQWFETDLPVPDIELGEIVLDPLLVVHELVEIDEIIKMGLAITQDVIVRNPEKIDDAHLKACKIELMVAKMTGASEHLKKRIEDIETRCIDETLTERRRAEYRMLAEEAKGLLSRIGAEKV